MCWNIPYAYVSPPLNSIRGIPLSDKALPGPQHRTSSSLDLLNVLFEFDDAVTSRGFETIIDNSHLIPVS